MKVQISTRLFVVVAMFCAMSAMGFGCLSTQHQMVKPNDVVKQTEAVKRAEVSNFAFKPYPVIVDYGRSVSQMVAGGKYDLMNESDIAADSFRDPAKKGKVNVNLYLVHLGVMVKDEEAARMLDALGFLPADNDCLRTFGETYPKKQLEYPIIALGNAFTDAIGRYYVSYLDECEPGMRCLHENTVVKPGEKWQEHCRFLAVQK